MNYRKKKNIITTAIVIGVVLFLILLISLFTGNSKYDGMDQMKVKWSVGTITDSGAFDNTDTTCLVSDRIKLGNGFMIEPKFTKGVVFNVYYYDKDDMFICAEFDDQEYRKLTRTAIEIHEQDASIEYFRIVFTPEDKDENITTIEKWKYSNHIDVYEITKKK